MTNSPSKPWTGGFTWIRVICFNLKFRSNLNVRFAPIPHPGQHLNKSERSRAQDPIEGLSPCEYLAQHQFTENSNQT